jgi:hypothetical protein
MRDEAIEQFYDVLQNVEFAISCAWENELDLLDFDVIDALDALVRRYAAEGQGRTPPVLRLSERAKHVYVMAERMCEWRLGRTTLNEDEQDSVIPHTEYRTVDEILVCLKRIRKSAHIWNEQLGRQGYLSYITNFFRQMKQRGRLRPSFLA